MTITKETVTFSRDTWDELYSNDYYREVLEAIEDRESLRDAKLQADESERRINSYIKGEIKEVNSDLVFNRLKLS